MWTAAAHCENHRRIGFQLPLVAKAQQLLVWSRLLELRVKVVHSTHSLDSRLKLVFGVEHPHPSGCMPPWPLQHLPSSPPHFALWHPPSRTPSGSHRFVLLPSALAFSCLFEFSRNSFFGEIVDIEDLHLWPMIYRSCRRLYRCARLCAALTLSPDCRLSKLFGSPRRTRPSKCRLWRVSTFVHV